METLLDWLPVLSKGLALAALCTVLSTAVAAVYHLRQRSSAERIRLSEVVATEVLPVGLLVLVILVVVHENWNARDERRAALNNYVGISSSLDEEIAEVLKTRVTYRATYEIEQKALRECAHSARLPACVELLSHHRQPDRVH